MFSNIFCSVLIKHTTHWDKVQSLEKSLCFQNEMSSLKADNSRLQKLICSKGLNPGSPTNPTPDTSENRLSLGDPSSLGIYNPGYHGNHTGHHGNNVLLAFGVLTTIHELWWILKGVTEDVVWKMCCAVLLFKLSNMSCALYIILKAHS